MLEFSDIMELEDKILAPYAAKSKDSKGRLNKEEEHPYRGIYQRDRDRIVHSMAFRRLEYKTQVFLNHEGDYYRTRLTHTLEVAQIARSMAKALRLNEELTEAIALAHDLGHTPFGHSGEDALQELMKDHGGFNHNRQSLRVVDYLESRYPDFRGLNLTWEAREGIAKHTTSFDSSQIPQELQPDILPSLEAQVVDVADEIAYDNHDLDDGLTSNMVDEDALYEIELWHEISKRISGKFPKLSKEIRIYQIIKTLIDTEVSDALKYSEQLLEKFKIKSLRQAKEIGQRLITFSPRISSLRRPMKEFLFKNLYQHYRVIRMSNKAKRFINELFACYLQNPNQLPSTSRARLKQEDTHRVICDYIAGMTDRYAQDEYKKLFEPYERVL